MGWLRYWLAVADRAWSETWAMIVERSVWAVVRDAFLLGISIWALIVIGPALANWDAVSSVADALIWAAAGLVVIAAVFAAVFVVMALLVTPYRMWQEAEASDPTRPIFEPADEPHRDWLSLKDAPFVVPFWPEYQNGGGWEVRWIEDMLTPIDVPGPPRHPDMRRNAAAEMARNDHGHDLVVARIDWEKRQFVWKWERPATETSPTGYFGMNPYPEDLWDGDRSGEKLLARTPTHTFAPVPDMRGSP